MYVRGMADGRYRWVVLAAGTLAQASFSASSVGLPALGPVLKSHYGLTLSETGVVLAASAGTQRAADGDRRLPNPEREPRARRRGTRP